MKTRTSFSIVVLVFILSACGSETTNEASQGNIADTASPLSNGKQTSAHANQEIIDRISRSLNVKYRVNANKHQQPCFLPNGDKYDGAVCYEGQITLTADTDINGGDWSIFFSQVEPVANFESDEFEVVHINGDLHRIHPTEAFNGFVAGEKRTIDIIVRGQVLTEAKLMPNYYVVADGAEARVIESTRIGVDDETGLPIKPFIHELTGAHSLFNSNKNDLTPLATAAFLFEANKETLPASPEVVDRTIIPTPSHVELGDPDSRLELSSGIIVRLHGLERKSIVAPLERLALFDIPERKDGVPVDISLRSAPSKPTGTYTLEVGADEIRIVGADPAGAAYGLYSLASLITLGKTDVPLLRVEDTPRFEFRGMHVDVARNFHPKETILKLLDQMAAYKLNKLHFHLADDEGWRLEIPGLPELTEIGARRCHDLTENNCLLPQLGSGPTGNASVDGYYSTADYIEILQAAHARHIQVIPSLDMPGHARAAVKSMEARYRKLRAQGRDKEASQYLLTDLNDETVYESYQYYTDNTINPCMESSYAFVSKVIGEVKKAHESAGHPLTRYHIGADETAGAWKESPLCKAFLAHNEIGVASVDQLGAYFVERVAAILTETGIETAAWNDGLGQTDPTKMPDVVQSNSWSVLASAGSAAAHDHANRGWDVVLSTPDALYFDFPYEADPKEGGYYWGARRVNTRKVFEFMPDNLPIHAEFWKDSNEQPFEIDDTQQTDDDGVVINRPLQEGVRVTGMQGQIWTETVASQEVLENRVFPRLLALAERAWHKATWEVPYNNRGAVFNQDTDFFSERKRAERDANWSHFATALGAKEMMKLDRANIAYRIPTVGARIENGVLDTNLIFPGLSIEYREEGGTWKTLPGKTAVSGVVEVRAVSADGDRRGRSLQAGQPDAPLTKPR